MIKGSFPESGILYSSKDLHRKTFSEFARILGFEERLQVNVSNYILRSRFGVGMDLLGFYSYFFSYSIIILQY